MQGSRQENCNVGDGDLQSVTRNQKEIGRDQINNQPPSSNSREASLKSPSRSDSSIPYPFDSQSSLENEDGNHGMLGNTIEIMSKS